MGSIFGLRGKLDVESRVFCLSGPHEYGSGSGRADATHGAVPELKSNRVSRKTKEEALPKPPQTPPPAAGDAAEAHLSQPGAAPGTPATRDTH